MQVPCCICTKITQKSYIWRIKKRDRNNFEDAMWKKGDRINRRRVLPGSYPYVNKNTAKRIGIRYNRISKGKKHFNDIRSTRTSQIQIWKQTFLVQRILCRYSRKKYQKDTRIHSASIARRYCQWSDKPIWISRPVYGWACEERQIKHRFRGCPRKRCGWQIFEHASAAGNIPL